MGDETRTLNDDEALCDLAARSEDVPDLTALPAEWRAPLADVARDLLALDPEYRLDHLRWDGQGVRIEVVERELDCCSKAWVDGSWGQHLSDETPLHRVEREGLEERSFVLHERCERAFHESLHWGDPPRPEPTDPRPVVALDIDGVLSPVSRPPLRRVDVDGVPHVIIAGMFFPAGEEEEPAQVRDLPSVVVHVPRGTCENPFFAGSQRDIEVRVRFDPDVIAWVESLHERAEVVWATTWEEAGNLFAEAVGLPPLRVGVSHQRHPVKLSQFNDGDAAGWKGAALAEEFENRPLVWIDDLAGWHQRSPFWRHPSDVEQTLVVVPEEHVGITPEHIAVVEAFLDRWTKRENEQAPGRS